MGFDFSLNLNCDNNHARYGREILTHGLMFRYIIITKDYKEQYHLPFINFKETMSRFYLVRHGNVNTPGVLSGRTPENYLSQHGIKQIEAQALQLSKIKVDLICSSPLDRTRQTSEIIAAPHRLDIQYFDELQEVDFGDWTGKRFEDLEGDNQWKLFHTFRSGTRIPNGELIIEVQRRMIVLIETLRKQYENSNIVIVSHGDPIRTVLCYYLGMPLDYMLRFKVSIASISILDINDWGPEVLAINITSEFPPE